MANQAWQITSPGQLSLSTLPDVPQPGPNQVLVRIHAASLNYRDKLIVEHSPDYPVAAKANLIPASDGAGIVEEAGPNSRWKKGDRVNIHANPWLTGVDDRDFHIDEVLGGGDVDGTLRKFMVVGDDRVVKAPEGLSFEEVSTMFTAGVTAWRALMYGTRNVGPGVTVLTQGTGGVSSTQVDGKKVYAIMIAAAAGATVIATSSSDEKLEIARKHGATHLINYRRHPKWADQVLQVTDGKGVDLVVDVVGAESIEETMKALSYGGEVCVCGLLGKNPTQPVNIMLDILYGAKTFRGQLGAGSRQVHEELSAFMEKHQLHPPIAQSFDFEEADKALEALATLSAPGKIVVRC